MEGLARDPPSLFEDAVVALQRKDFVAGVAASGGQIFAAGDYGIAIHGSRSLLSGFLDGHAEVGAVRILAEVDVEAVRVLDGHSTRFLLRGFIADRLFGLSRQKVFERGVRLAVLLLSV